MPYHIFSTYCIESTKITEVFRNLFDNSEIELKFPLKYRALYDWQLAWPVGMVIAPLQTKDIPTETNFHIIDIVDRLHSAPVVSQDDINTDFWGKDSDLIM